MCRDVIEKPLLKNLNSQVHVWFCRPEDITNQSRLSSYRALLSDHELGKLDRLKFAGDRHNYLVSHAMLRLVLSKYMAVDANDIQFDHNAHGKPALRLREELPAIEFNLTHTDGLCACVVVLGTACGIDAENIHRKNNLQAVAKRMFSDEELDVLLVDKEMDDDFFDYWTLRESYVKALGTGLSGSSKDFYFTVANNGVADDHAQAVGSSRTASIHYGPEAENLLDWHFRLFSPTRTHRIAVAYESNSPLNVLIDEVVL
jgi:4'-phosphopantetheinyl transferase